MGVPPGSTSSNRQDISQQCASAIVDVEDTDEVLNLVINHLLELPVEERLSAHVTEEMPHRRTTINHSSLAASGAAQ